MSVACVGCVCGCGCGCVGGSLGRYRQARLYGLCGDYIPPIEECTHHPDAADEAVDGRGEARACQRLPAHDEGPRLVAAAEVDGAGAVHLQRLPRELGVGAAVGGHLWGGGPGGVSSGGGLINDG